MYTSELVCSQTSVMTTEGMVTSNHYLAANAGASILAQGGNAVDAALATSFAVGVVEPAMSGLAGRGYLVLHIPTSSESVVIDGHERAPMAARPDMFQLDTSQPLPDEPVPGWGMMPAIVDDANSQGHVAVAVPGVLGALAIAHRRYGRLPWKHLFEPAITLAAEGVPVSVPLATLLARSRSKLARFPATAEIFFRDGHTLLAGDTLVQTDLAGTLRKIAEHGVQEFYTGTLAESIAAEIAAGGGVLTSTDLAAFQPRVWDTPLRTTYRGHEVLTVPEAAGGITLVEILNVLEGYDLASLPAFEPSSLHLLIEAMRVAFRDRHAFLDDPEFVDVPLAGLASKAFAAQRRESISLESAQSHPGPGDPWAFEQGARPHGIPHSFLPSDSDTTHFCVVDCDRMVVSMTQSIIDAFGSGLVVPGTGMLLNSAMHNFNPVPNELRSIAPWKRAAHYGTPTIVLSPDGLPRVAIGGAGGTMVTTGVAQILVNILDRGMSAQEAVAAPRIHNEGWGTLADARLTSGTLEMLGNMGHHLDVVAPGFAKPAFSRINAIGITDGGCLSSGVDIFTDAGAAAGGVPRS